MICLCNFRLAYFNPRPPWGGRLVCIDFFLPDIRNFNPRPPWGGRHLPRCCLRHYSDFNPRPPWGGRLCQAALYRLIHIISIHALRGEGDKECGHNGGKASGISIHALRGEGDDNCKFYKTANDDISIHALRGEGDRFAIFGILSPCNFNPRPPWGGRLQKYTNMQCYACT